MSMQAGKQEEDRIESGPIFVIAAVVVAIMILTFIGVKNYAVGHEAKLVTETASVKVPMMPNGEPLQESHVPQFGMLHQTLFDAVSDARDLRTISEQKLSSYKWIENGKTAQIPIERAMQILEQQRAAQAPQQQPAPQQTAPAPEQQKPEEQKKPEQPAQEKK